MSAASPVSSTKRRWNVAVRKALELKQQEDLVGDLILRQLLSRSNNENELGEGVFKWTPLLSRHNLRFVKAKWKLYRNNPRRIPGAISHVLVSSSRPAAKGQLLFFVRLLVVCLVLMAVAMAYAIIWTMRTLYAALAYLFVLFVDWEDLQKNCPQQVKSAVQFVISAARNIDDYILLGRQYSGREWNEHGYIDAPVPSYFGATAAQQYNNNVRSLMELPPPPFKPDTHSAQTMSHVAAIEYCHAMLQREENRKKEKRRKQQEINRRKLLLEKESTIVEESSTSHRNGGDCDQFVSPMRGGVAILTEASTASPDIELMRIKGVLSSPDILSDDDMDQSEFGDSAYNSSSNLRMDLETAADMPWLDVGRKIGMRLLHSEHVQRAMTSQETKDRILETVTDLVQAPSTEPRNKQQKGTTATMKPMHCMWSSPEAAASGTILSTVLSTSSYTDHEDGGGGGGLGANDTDAMFSASGRGVLSRSQTFPGSPASDRPPLSPRGNESARVLGSPTRRRDRDNASPNSIVSRPAPSPPDIRRKALPESLKQTTPFPSMLNPDNNSTHGGSFSPKKPVHRRAQTIEARAQEVLYRRVPLPSGVKVAVPMFPVQPGKKAAATKNTAYQMATVVASRRILVGSDDDEQPLEESTNCLSVTVKLEKSFLRHGEFAELTFRVMDAWSPRYMPRHSKVPIGSCVATSFGLGVLVGWRVEDDCHVVRSLWQCRGPGACNAYLNRHAIHSTIEAAVGFRVQTLFGWGLIISVVNGGKTFEHCRFFVEIKEEGRHKGNVLELNRNEILSCHGAQFMPVIEHVREAALYQIQLDNYNAAVREQLLDGEAPTVEQELLRSWAECGEILWKSFLKAVEEDKDFDDGMNDFMKSIIDFLDRLDQDDNGSDGGSDIGKSFKSYSNEIEVKLASTQSDEPVAGEESQEPGFWIMNDLFGGVFQTESKGKKSAEKVDVDEGKSADKLAAKHTKLYDRVFAFLRTIMKTVSIARASSVDYPHFRLALAISYDFLLFVRTIVKIQQRNTSSKSLRVWKRAWEEIVLTFGPIKDRLESIGRGIVQRMERQGRKAKIRVLKFVDKLLGDDRLLFAMEQGEWDRCLARVEIALVEAEVIQEENLFYYRKAAKFVYDNVQKTMKSDGGAATRNSEKLAFLAHFVQALASPRRSILKFFCRDDMLELFERILVRAYYKEELATRMLTIHAANFHSLRHLRMLKDFSVAGRIWIPLLDAADEEFSWLVSKLPENSKGIMCPLSSLFSLCVAQFHRINAGDQTKDWLAFLLDGESVEIIHAVDMMCILALESFSRDVREMMTVLPYYPSIDMDILNLMDEVNIDEFLKEMSEAMDDPDKLSEYVREKATIGIERFLNYLPKMSIPVEKRELGEGWVLTCHGEDGGGLTLTDVTIKRENLVCQVMGGDTMFFPMFSDEEPETKVRGGAPAAKADEPTAIHEEESILDHIKELILNAQRHGCWKPGVGGVDKPPTDRYAASVFRDLPVSGVLNCGIELWRNLELDDDELLEIAIRDITYHIQLHEELEEQGDLHRTNKGGIDEDRDAEDILTTASSFGSQFDMMKMSSSSSFESPRNRFNPRVDPTVLFLEIKRLTLNLDNFFFRIEKGSKKTIFDPVFEGRGMLSLQNVSIRLRVECAKERVKTSGVGVSTPILHLRDLDCTLEKLEMTVQDTGFGSDWILNKGVTVFEDQITEVVVDNLKEQIKEQAQNLIENLNSYFLMNPGLLLNLLGISMDDLDENVVWV